MNATQWYEGNDSELTPKEKARIATRGILDKPRGGWKARGHAIYRNLESALIEAGLPSEGNVFEHVAYMNAYQRPAKDGDSLKSTALDIERAVETLNGVIAAIEPDNVFFVSRQAQKELGKRLTVFSHDVSHPTTYWWNKRQKRLSNRTGREYFIARIRRYLNGEQL